MKKSIIEAEFLVIVFCISGAEQNHLRINYSAYNAFL